MAAWLPTVELVLYGVMADADTRAVPRHIPRCRKTHIQKPALRAGADGYVFEVSTRNTGAHVAPPVCGYRKGEPI